MVVQVPFPPATEREADVDAGVIDDARRRQRLHRRVGVSLLVLVAAGALLAGIAAGGGGAGGGRGGGGGRAEPSGSGPGSGATLASSRTAFPGAPSTQASGYGVETDFCPLAPPNRYLPARAGCVTVRRADMNGDGRADLVIVYSTLTRERPTSYMGEPVPSGLRGDFGARAAFLRVVLAGGGTATARIRGTRMTHAAAMDAIARVNREPGEEIFLDVQRVSSGGTVVAYGFSSGHLVPAGPLLEFGGDAAGAATFDCLSGPPRVVVRSLALLGPTIYGWWRETRVTYAWHGRRLVPVNRRTFRRHGGLTNADYAIGRGCLRGIG